MKSLIIGIFGLIAICSASDDELIKELSIPLADARLSQGAFIEEVFCKDEGSHCYSFGAYTEEAIVMTGTVECDEDNKNCKIIKIKVGTYQPPKDSSNFTDTIPDSIK